MAGRVGVDPESEAGTRRHPVVVGEAEKCPVYADRAAIETDHIVIVNRVKEHTEFIGPIESGLLKMSVVGLGRVAGAEVMHQLAVRISYVKAIQAIARVLFRKLPILGGVAILEDKTNTVRRLEAVPADFDVPGCGEQPLFAQVDFVDLAQLNDWVHAPLAVQRAQGALRDYAGYTR